MAEVEIRQRELALQQNHPVPTVSMHMLTGPDRRRYNQPLQEDELSAIFTSTDGAAAVLRDIVNSDPMTYPLLYPFGEPGWSLNIPHVAGNATENRNLVTLMQFYYY